MTKPGHPRRQPVLSDLGLSKWEMSDWPGEQNTAISGPGGGLSISASDTPKSEENSREKEQTHRRKDKHSQKDVPLPSLLEDDLRGVSLGSYLLRGWLLERVHRRRMDGLLGWIVGAAAFSAEH